MLRRFSTNFAIFSIFADAASIIFTLRFIARVRPLFDKWFGNLPFLKDVFRPVRLPMEIYILFPLIWIAIMLSFSVYDGRKNIRVVDEFGALTVGSILAGITLAGILYFTYRDVSRALFASFLISTYLAFLLWRILVRALYWRRNESRARVQHILVIGAGAVGTEIRTRIKGHRHLHLEFLGFLDDDSAKRSRDPEVLGPVDDARTLVKSGGITHVVIALPLRAYQRVAQLITELQDLPVRIWVVPDYFQYALHQARIDDFLSIPMLDLRAPALTENERMMKRVFDLLVCLLLLVPFLVVMLGSALLIWLDDGLPILFKQKRVGENGRLFTMYKFRTMVKNAEQMQALVEQTDADGHVVHKRRDDPRVTRAGRILRRLSIDEFPQLFNVMRGTMSLVGPRPELPYLVEKYQSWQRKRFAVPQGVTGWWQIHGRSDKPMHLHTEDDLFYVQNYSLWLDIQILIRTGWIVIRGKGAY